MPRPGRPWTAFDLDVHAGLDDNVLAFAQVGPRPGEAEAVAVGGEGAKHTGLEVVLGEFVVFFDEVLHADLGGVVEGAPHLHGGGLHLGELAQ